MRIKVNGRQGYTPYSPATTVLQSLVVTRPAEAASESPQVEEKKEVSKAEASTEEVVQTKDLSSAAQTEDVSSAASAASAEQTEEATATEQTEETLDKGEKDSPKQPKQVQASKCEGEM
jgi:hypothetical protein